MKETDARVDGGHELVLYVEREDETYGPLRTGSYMAAHHLEDLNEKRRRWARDCLDRLIAGAISPIGYYLGLLEMTEAELAMRAGVRAGRVRRHVTPRGFATVRMREARRYAAVFDIPLAALFQVVDEQAGVETRVEPTGCEGVTVLRISSAAGGAGP